MSILTESQEARRANEFDKLVAERIPEDVRNGICVPVGIDADVWVVSVKVYDEILTLLSEILPAFTKQEVIARAVQAERERCASIAENYARKNGPKAPMDKEGRYLQTAGQTIAAAIRNRHEAGEE